MNEKEFVLVSQGIEIYRTKSQENAVNMVKKENDEYFDYLQKCYDNYERPADNYVDLEIEYSDEKEKDKEIERLNKEIDRLNETNIVLEDSTNHWYYIVEELEKSIRKEIERTESLIQDDYEHGLGTFGEIRKILNEERKNWLYKIKELKGSDKE